MRVRTSRSCRHVAVLASAAAVAAALVTAPVATAHISTTPKWVRTARAQLSRLPVRPAGSMTGYSREMFGEPWADVDRNGCDTRDDILHRDLTHIVYKSGSSCVIARGTLRDPYTGKTINFVRGVGTSTAVQIDHVVALADAWRTGAAAWTPARRLAYANTPLVLLAVDGPANEVKGDSDAAEWLPPRVGYRCRYVARQVSIKTRFHLSLTPAERGAISRILDGCL